MKISVVLPTYRRAAMLRSALLSIQGQSRRDLIAEIVVSENGLEQGSGKVCEEFADLPLRYVFQEKPFTAYQHIHKVLNMATSEWVAMIGDDDMWSRYHLEEAQRQLMTHQADGYAAQGSIVENESRQVVRGYIRPMCSTLLPESAEFSEVWKWSLEQFTVELLTRIPINIWTVVARRDYIQDALSVFATDESYDCDRLACWRLATRGKLVLGRELGTFIRQHEAAWSKNMWQQDESFHTEASFLHTQTIINEASALGLNVRQLWQDIWQRLDPRMQEEVWKSSFPGARRCLVEAWGFDPGSFCQASHARSGRLARVVKQLTPPLISNMLKRLNGRRA